MPYTESDDISERLEFKFRSWSEFISNVELRYKKDISFTSHNESRDEHSGSFNSHDSLEDAIAELKVDKPLSHEGKNKIYETVKNHIKLKISDEPLAGIDIPAYLSGQPECFESFVPKKVKVRKQRESEIFVMVGVTAGVTERELTNYIKDVMEMIYRDYNFNKLVISIISDYNNGRYFQLYVDIPFRDVSYILRTTFSDFPRRIGFFLKEQHSKCHNGYGRSLYDNESKLKEFFGEKAKIFTYDNHSREVRLDPYGQPLKNSASTLTAEEIRSMMLNLNITF